MKDTSSDTSRSIQQRHREVFFSLISRHLNGLYHFIRHQLGYHEALGDLLPGELSPEDVMDAVLVRAYREFVSDPPEKKVGSWLIRVARGQLEAEIKRLKSWRNRTPVRIEQDIPDTPPTEWVSTMGDEVLDFHEPDEDLKLEDVLTDLDIPTPEEEAEARELRFCVAAALAGIPTQWREALLLRYAEGLSGADLAEALGQPELEVRRILDQTRHYLRQRLVESGCRFKEAAGE